MIMAFDPADPVQRRALRRVRDRRCPRARCSIRGSPRRCPTASTSTPASSTARAARSGRRRRSCRWRPATAPARCSCSPGSTGRRVLPVRGAAVRRDPRPADRRRARRSLLVADVPHHAGRIHRGLLPGRDRALHAGARLGRRRACTAAAPGSRRSTCSPRPGEFTVHDDRALISPWGIGGGRAGGRSSKQLIRADGTVRRAAVEGRRLSRRGRGAARVPHRRRGRLGRSAAAARRPRCCATCSASWSPRGGRVATTAW